MPRQHDDTREVLSMELPTVDLDIQDFALTIPMFFLHRGHIALFYQCLIINIIVLVIFLDWLSQPLTDCRRGFPFPSLLSRVVFTFLLLD